MGALPVDFSRRYVVFQQTLDLIAKHLDAHRPVIVPGGENLDDVAAHPEFSAVKADVVALVLNGDEFPQNRVPVDLLPLVQGNDHLMIALRRAKAVNARHARHHDDIAALEQRAGCRVAQLIDLIVDRSVLLDICIRRRNVRLRLVEIVIAHEVADVVFREKGLELARELRRQRLIVRDDEGRLLHALNRLGDGEGLTRPRRP